MPPFRFVNKYLPYAAELKTFEESAGEVDCLIQTLGGEIHSRQVICAFVVLLKRIEDLEARLDANGIYL